MGFTLFLPSSKDIASAITKAANSPTLNPAAATRLWISYYIYSNIYTIR